MAVRINSAYDAARYECLTDNLKDDINAWRKGEKNAEDSSSGYDSRFTYRGN